MSQGIIIKRCGSGYATINFDLPIFDRTTPTPFSQAKGDLASTSIGNYALFGGGYTGSSPSNVVDAYTNHYKIQVYPGTKYSFNGSSEAESNTLQTLNYTGALAGYLKVKNASVN